MPSDARHGGDLFQLAALSPGELGKISGMADGHPAEGTDVRVAPVRYDWSSPATAGLWRVDVRAGQQQDTPACTYFVKLLRHPRLWPQLSQLPTAARREEFVAFLPWRFELDMYECGIGQVLPPGMRTPVLHHVKHIDADHIALWWEYITERAGPWRLADYRRAARMLGRLAARRRAGAEINLLMPERARSSPPLEALRYYTEGRVLLGAVPMLAAGKIWRHPVVVAALRRAADPGLPADLVALGERLPKILDQLETLPLTYAHGDASPQNLLLPADDPDAIVVIDWGFGSLLPVGFDLGQLLVGLMHAGRAEPSELPEIDAVIFPAYLDGLRAEDYAPDPGQVRAGYIGSLAARSALCALPAELLTSAAPDEATEDLFLQRLQLTRAMVDMAAEI